MQFYPIGFLLFKEWLQYVLSQCGKFRKFRFISVRKDTHVYINKIVLCREQETVINVMGLALRKLRFFS